MSSTDSSGGEKLFVERLTHVPQKRLSEPKRFAILAAGAFAALCASTSYAFNLFSGAMQTKYQFSLRDMSSINTVGMVFAYFLLPYGAVYDYFGPLPLYILACILFPLGAVLMGLTFGDKLEGTMTRFCVYNALLSLGSQLFDLASVVTVLSVFPTDRGAVVAFLKTLMGLGSAILGAVYIGYFRNRQEHYFYFLIALVVCVGAIVMTTVRLPVYHLTGYEQSHLGNEEKERRLAYRAVYLRQKAPTWRFVYGLGVIVVLIIYLPLQGALGTYLKLGKPYLIAFATVAVVLTLLLALIAVPCDYLDNRFGGQKRDRRPDTERELERVHENMDDAVVVSAKEGENPSRERPLAEEIETDVDYIAPQYQTTFLQSLCTLKLWAIFWTYFCGVGAEFVIIFNARFILTSLSGEPVSDSMGTLLTVLNGAGSAVGRLLMSAFEAWSQKRKAEDRIPITISVFVSTVFIIVAIVLFLVLPTAALPVAYAVAAVGNGFCASVSILLLRTLYAKDPAKHYNFAYIAIGLSAILLNRLLYGEWVAREAERYGKSLCFHKSCVMMPLLVMLGLNVTAFFSNVYLHWSYCKFSKKVLAERRRVKEEAAASWQGPALCEYGETVGVEPFGLPTEVPNQSRGSN